MTVTYTAKELYEEAGASARRRLEVSECLSIELTTNFTTTRFRRFVTSFFTDTIS